MRTTFSRNSIASARTSAGVLQLRGNDVARRETDFETGNFLGLLIEQQSTNLWTLDRRFGSGGGYEFERFVHDPYEGQLAARIKSTDAQLGRINPIINTGSVGGAFSVYASLVDSAQFLMRMNYRDDGEGNNYQTAAVNPAARSITSSTFETLRQAGASFDRYAISASRKFVDGYVEIRDWSGVVTLYGAQFEDAPIATSYIPSDGRATTRSADFWDAPAGDWLPPGRHTWRGLVRMSADPREPTILGHPGGRIYASGGRLLLDGPGTLWQPDGEHAPGALVPFYWTVELPGAPPDFALGRAAGDTDWWNSHLVDIVPYPRVISESEIRRELGL